MLSGVMLTPKSAAFRVLTSAVEMVALAGEVVHGATHATAQTAGKQFLLNGVWQRLAIVSLSLQSNSRSLHRQWFRILRVFITGLRLPWR